MSDRTDRRLEEGFDVHVSILAPDGASSWIADVKVPALGIEWQGMILHGADHDEATADAGQRVLEYYLRTRSVPASN